MPTYAYRCTTCNHRFDAVQRMADDPLTECPSCRGFVKRTIQNVPVVFKGSGWYITDSRKSKDSPAKDSSTPKTDSATPATSGDGEKASEKAKTAKTESVAAAAD